MTKSSYESLEFLFHPRSIALVGVTIANPEHWSRAFLDSLLEFEFEHPIYLVNPKGGEIHGLKVYRSLRDIPDTVDYVISSVPAKAALGVIEECADREVKAIHFYTAGFRETGEEERARLEAELVKLSRRKGVRIVGPNCVGIYCPQSRLSFRPNFPKESGPVAFLSQSGGNATGLVKEAAWRGVRFSKVISYGNACDLNESDFLEYLTTDPDTKIIGLYVEGVNDGRRFRQVLEKAAKEKVVLLLKGGITQGGARAAAGHTGSLAGEEVIWESLCKQLGIIRVRSLEELVDTMVTLLFMPPPKGRNAALIGMGGGSSVLIADEFEKKGIKVPPLPQEIRNQIREFTPVAGNILQNPLDYSQTMVEMGKLFKAVSIISRWEAIDFLIGFMSPARATPYYRGQMFEMADKMFEASRVGLKPMAMVLETSILPDEAKEIFPLIQKCISFGLPVYYSFASAAKAISLVLSHNERRLSN